MFIAYFQFEFTFLKKYRKIGKAEYSNVVFSINHGNRSDIKQNIYKKKAFAVLVLQNVTG